MGLRKAIQNWDPIQVEYVQTAAAGTAPDAFIFTNPSTSGEYYEIVSVVAQWDVVGGASAAADVKIVPTATALASGTTALAAAFDLTAGARASTKATLTATVANRVVAPGSAVAVDTSGTLTGLAGLCIVVYMRPMRGKKSIS